MEKKELEDKLVATQNYSDKIQMELDSLKEEVQKLMQDKKLFGEQIEQ